MAVIAVTGAIVFLLQATRRSRRTYGSSNEYNAAGALLTEAERSFFGTLQQSVSSGHLIFTKVRLADIIEPTGHWGEGRRYAFNRISQKHVDFVLCDRENFRVKLVIELDDRSHERAGRRERDAFVDSALASAGIPVLHVPARQHYSAAMIGGQIEGLLRENRRVGKVAA